jgi:hypothetical protein
MGGNRRRRPGRAGKASLMPHPNLKLHTGVVQNDDGKWEAIAVITGDWSKSDARRAVNRLIGLASSAIAKPESPDRLSRSVDENGWSAWEKPIQEGYRLTCCTCGLVHNMNFRVRRGQVEFQVQVNHRATAATRRGTRFRKIKTVLKERT